MEPIPLHRYRWPLAWLAWCLPVVLAIALVTPPWQNSDEPLHLARAVQLAHGGLLGWREWNTSGGLSDHRIYDAYGPVSHVAMRPEQHPTGAELRASAALRWSHRLDFTSFPNTVQYGPLFYLPDIAGYWFGRAAGLHINATLRVARLLNALAYALITAAALALARRTRFLLAALLMLPMSLSLAASAAQDGPMIATTALVVALIDRITAEGRRESAGEVWWLAFLLAAVGMARPPYAGFLLAIPVLGPRCRRTWLAAAIAGLVTLGWCLVIAVHVTVPFGGADIHRQLARLEAYPRMIPGVAARTLWRFGGRYWRQFIGCLGWTDTKLPLAYTVFASLALIAPALATGARPPRAPLLPALGVLFSVAAIFVLQFLTWTWPGQIVVTGVLGRYFIPPALVLALAVPAIRLDARRLAAAARISLIGLALVTPPVTIATLLTRYAVR